MPRRTLSMVVEGEDKSGPAMASAGKSVEELGRKVSMATGPMPAWHTAWEKYNAVIGEAPWVTEAAAESIEKTSKASSSAVMPLAYLASSFGIVNRRAAITVGRIFRLGQMVTKAGDDAGSSARKWILLGAGMIAIVAIAVAVGRAVVQLGKRIIEWSGLSERSAFSLREMSQAGQEAKAVADELAWAMERLGPPSERTAGGMKLTADAVDELGDRVSYLMRKWGPLADAEYAAALAAAEHQAVMELEARTALEIIDAARDAAPAIDRWDEATGTLADTTKTRLQPAYDEVLDSITELVTDKGPSAVTVLGQMSDAFAPRLTNVIEEASSKLGIFLGLLAALQQPVEIRWEILKGLAGFQPDFARPSPVQTPMPAYPPGWQYERIEQPSYGYQPRDVHVSGSIAVDVNVTGDLPQVGAEIGRGIQSELQRVGME